MSTPTHSLLESQILVACERLARVSVLGYVSTTQILKRLPQDPTPAEFDRAVRHLKRRGIVEVFDPRWPPSGPHQSIRRR